MESLKVYYDEVGQTLTIWFGDPTQEFIAEETDEEVILMKNKAGNVIGIERLHFSPINATQLSVELIKI